MPAKIGGAESYYVETFAGTYSFNQMAFLDHAWIKSHHIFAFFENFENSSQYGKKS